MNNNFNMQLSRLIAGSTLAVALFAASDAQAQRITHRYNKEFGNQEFWGAQQFLGHLARYDIRTTTGKHMRVPARYRSVASMTAGGAISALGSNAPLANLLVETVAWQGHGGQTNYYQGSQRLGTHSARARLSIRGVVIQQGSRSPVGVTANLYRQTLSESKSLPVGPVSLTVRCSAGTGANMSIRGYATSPPKLPGGFGAFNRPNGPIKTKIEGHMRLYGTAFYTAATGPRGWRIRSEHKMVFADATAKPNFESTEKLSHTGSMLVTQHPLQLSWTVRISRSLFNLARSLVNMNSVGGVWLRYFKPPVVIRGTLSR